MTGFNKAALTAEEQLNLLIDRGLIVEDKTSLAWMINKKPYIVPIPWSRKLERLQENLNSANVILSADEIKNIDERLDTMDFLVFGGNAAK